MCSKDKSPSYQKRAGHRVRMYGIARRTPDGRIECMMDSSLASMGWSSLNIFLWDEPPLHYCRGYESDRRFIIRINSDSSPVLIVNTNYVYRCNFSFTVKCSPDMTTFVY